jgi:glyoxylase-like metal-dependent hydrolase (beta-lactamase superfamily II)
MEIIRIGSLATAFIRKQEGVNAGLIHTPAGMILIDTTSSPAEARSLFTAMDARLEEVRLVINTHFHSDHTWGNQVFSCPILAHRLCQELMKSSLKKDWSTTRLHSYLSGLVKTNPQKAEDFRQTLKDLHITLPDQVFVDRLEGELGGVKYELIHLGGHTPDLSVVWLHESGVLFASDLIFQGRYPYIFDSDVPAWIAQLNRLLEFEARVIVPGHGMMCSEAEIIALRAYLQETWELTEKHIHAGHKIYKTAADPAYPRFPGEKYERLHQANIRYMYKQLNARMDRQV